MYIFTAPDPTSMVTEAPEPDDTTQAPKPDTTAPEPDTTVTFEPVDSTMIPEPDTTEPIDTTQAPEPDTTQAPEPDTTQAPEPDTTQAPEPDTTQAPEPIVTTQAPESDTTEAPEPVDTTEPETSCPGKMKCDRAGFDLTHFTVCQSTEIFGSLYFEIDGEMYPSGSTISIIKVGAFTSSTGYFFPDSSLVCVTSEVNSQCCRERDGGNVGEWLYPDGSLVPRNSLEPNSDFSINKYNQEVRLNRRNNALWPAGEFTCRVPREDGCNDEMHVGTISLSKSSCPLPYV